MTKIHYVCKGKLNTIEIELYSSELGIVPIYVSTSIEEPTLFNTAAGILLVANKEAITEDAHNNILTLIAILMCKKYNYKKSIVYSILGNWYGYTDIITFIKKNEQEDYSELIFILEALMQTKNNNIKIPDLKSVVSEMEFYKIA